MDKDQSQALVELKNDIEQLQALFKNNTLDRDLIDRAYEKVVSVRCNANLIKSFVLDRMEEETLMVA